MAHFGPRKKRKNSANLFVKIGKFVKNVTCVC